MQYPLRAQVAREDTYYPPIFSSIPTNNCAPSRDLEIFPTDYSPLQHCLNFFLDLNAVQNTYSLVHRDLETDVPLAIPVPLVLQTLKQAFKSQYKDLKRMLLNDTNFVNNDTTKVTESGNKIIMKRVLTSGTNLVNKDTTIVANKGNKTLKKRVLPEDINFNRKDITKETNSDDKLIKKRVLPDNTNFVN